MCLAVIETALDRGPDARRNQWVADVHIERHMNAGGPAAREVYPLFHDRRDALAIDVLHCKDVDVRLPDRDLLGFIQIAHADEYRVVSEHLGREATDLRELGRLR